jgi:hypothetical protein
MTFSYRKRCQWCDETFETRFRSKKTCSAQCASKLEREKAKQRDAAKKAEPETHASEPYPHDPDLGWY